MGVIWHERKFAKGGQCIEKTKSDACFDDLSDEEDNELMLEDSSSEEEEEVVEAPKNETINTKPAVYSKKSPRHCNHCFQRKPCFFMKFNNQNVLTSFCVVSPN